MFSDHRTSYEEYLKVQNEKLEVEESTGTYYLSMEHFEF